MAFMDIQPVNAGHLLVIPLDHARSLGDLHVEVGAQLFRVGIELADALRRSGIRCEGINFLLADDEAAGQEVFHAHLYVIPRFKDDGFGLRFGPDYQRLPGREELDRAALKIRQALEG